MDNSFASKIKGIEARLNRLKTIGLSSASSLSVGITGITIPFTIIGTYIDQFGVVQSAGSSKIAYVRVWTENHAPAFVVPELVSPLNFGDRIISTQRTLAYRSDADYCYEIKIYGEQADVDFLNNGGTFSPQDHVFKFLCTSVARYEIFYRDTPITHD